MRGGQEVIVKKVLSILLTAAVMLCTFGNGAFKAFAESETEIIVDNADPGYSREEPTNRKWTKSTYKYSFRGSHEYIDKESNIGALFTAEIETGGKYSVYVYRPHIGSGNSAMTATVYAKDGSENVNYSLSGGSVGWYKIGVFAFDDNTEAVIRLCGSGSGIARMDAVKLVRVDETPPVITKVSPAENDVVSINVQPEITFSKPIAASFLTNEYISLFCGEKKISADIETTDGGKGARIIPNQPLDIRSAYRIVISEALEDEDGNKISGKLEYSFRTQNIDLTPANAQLVDSANPFPKYAKFYIEFDSEMNDFIYRSDCYSLSDGVDIVPLSAEKTSYKSADVMLTALCPLKENGEYTLRLSPKIKTRGGGNLASGRCFSVIADDGTEGISASLDSNYGVSATEPITVRFDGETDAATIDSDHIALKLLSGDEYVAATVENHGSYALVKPAKELARGCDYAIELHNVRGADGKCISRGDYLIFKTEAADTVISDMETEGSGYKDYGGWGTSSLTGYEGSQTRYAGKVDNPSETYAVWQPELKGGMYEVLIYRIYDEASTPEAEIEILGANGASKQIIPLTGFDESGWYSLGEYEFKAGSEGYVKLTKLYSDNNLRADAVMFRAAEEKSAPPKGKIENRSGVLTLEFDKRVSQAALSADIDGESAKFVSYDFKNFILVTDKYIGGKNSYNVKITDEVTAPGTESAAGASAQLNVSAGFSPIVTVYTDADGNECEAFSVNGKAAAFCRVRDDEEKLAGTEISVYALNSDKEVIAKSSGKYKSYSDGFADFEAQVDADKSDIYDVCAFMFDNAEKLSLLTNLTKKNTVSLEKNENADKSVLFKISADCENENAVLAIYNRNSGELAAADYFILGGEYDYTFVPSESFPGGEYIVRANSESGKEYAQTDFYHISSAEVEKAFAALNNAEDTDAVCAAIERYYRELGLDENVKEIFSELRDKTDVCTVILNNKEYSEKNSDVLAKLFSDATAVAAANGLNDFGEYFNLWADFFGIDAEKYNALVSKASMNEIFSSKRPFADAAAVKNAYNASIPLALINQSAYGAIENILEENYGVLEIKLDAYKKLTKSNQQKVLRAIAGKGFKTTEEFQKAFNSAVSGGSNSGGGGGGGSVSVPKVKSENAKIEGGASEQTPDKEKYYGFSDLSETPWAEKAILSLYEKSIVNGYGDKSFRPNGYVTREEFVKMITEAFSIKGEAQLTFADVSKNEWYSPYIERAYSSGIIKGISQENFGTGCFITRQDAAVIIDRTAERCNIPLDEKNARADFYDAADIAMYAEGAVSRLQMAGIMSGTAEHAFMPASYTTRAMAAKMIFELLVLTEEVK